MLYGKEHMAALNMMTFVLSSQLSPTLYRRVLVSLHSSVMPHLLDPRLLIDFLIDSYDAGVYIVCVCVCVCGFSSVMPHLLDPRLLIDFLIDSYDAGVWGEFIVCG